MILNPYNSNLVKTFSIASNNNYLDMVDLLISHNANIDQAQKDGVTALMIGKSEHN